MKKLIIVLMVVAMATFLFVGCFGTTPPIVPDEPDEPDEPILPTSVTPVIYSIAKIDLYSSDTQYVNEGEATDGIFVTGFAPRYSEVNVYINGDVVGTSTAYGDTDEFTVLVTEDNLGVDGAKSLYATATEIALAESAHSTEYAFTLDTVAPTITSVVGDASADYITVTFSEAVKATTVVAATWEYSADTVYTMANTTVVTVVITSATTARLYEATDTLLTGEYLSVKCSNDAVEDLADNEMVIPVTVLGYVVE